MINLNTKQILSGVAKLAPSTAQLKDYVKHGGGYCRVCRSDAFEGESCNYGDGIVYQPVLCLFCGAW